MIRFRKITDWAEMLREPRVVSVEEWCAEGVVGDAVGVDFETNYTSVYSVKKLGTYAYCQDERFDAYLVAVADREKVCVCRPEAFPWESIAGLEWLSHNREFDRHVWERLCELGILEPPGLRQRLRRGMQTARTDADLVEGVVQHRSAAPTAPQKQIGDRFGAKWRCSAAVCAFLQLPRDLAGAVEAVFGVEMDKSARSKAMGRFTTKNTKGTKDLFGGEVDEEMVLYAARDAVGCLALWDRLGDQWPGWERELFELTCLMGRRGLAMDWEYVEGCRERLEDQVVGLKESLPWSPALSLKQFGEWCEASGMPVPSSTGVDDPGFLEWREEHDGSEAAGWVETMQRIRSANRTEKVLASMLVRRSGGITTKNTKGTKGMDEGTTEGTEATEGKVGGEPLMPQMVTYVATQRSARPTIADRMVYELKYYGASTGRWSGGGGLNVQNLNRSSAEGVDLRRAIVASPGHVLAAVDFAQIESRVLLYLAGDDEALGMLRENPDADIYEVHARATMGYAPEARVSGVEGQVAGDLGEANVEHRTSNVERRREESLKEYCARTGSGLRQLAKARVLGLGFGCGAEKFVAVAKSMAGLEISLEESRRIVREYRESNPKVVELWRRLEAACRAKVVGDYVLPLPCTQWDRSLGRFLIYRGVHVAAPPSPRQRRDMELRCTVGGDVCSVYGGLLAENFTQATARDVLGFAWLRCAEAGYLPVLSVHDELVFELPVASAEEDLARIVGVMEEPVEWAPGLPLKAEGSLMEYYRK